MLSREPSIGTRLGRSTPVPRRFLATRERLADTSQTARRLHNSAPTATPTCDVRLGTASAGLVAIRRTLARAERSARAEWGHRKTVRIGEDSYLQDPVKTYGRADPSRTRHPKLVRPSLAPSSPRLGGYWTGIPIHTPLRRSSRDTLSAGDQRPPPPSTAQRSTTSTRFADAPTARTRLSFFLRSPGTHPRTVHRFSSRRRR